jgi:hypothetical protein
VQTFLVNRRATSGSEWKSYSCIIVLATHIARGQTSRTTSSFGSGSILKVFATRFGALDEFK